MSVASAGYSMYQSDLQQKNYKAMQGQAKLDNELKQSNLTAQQYRRRRSEGSTLLGQGSAASQAIADRGSVLTSTPETRSLLGG